MTLALALYLSNVLPHSGDQHLLRKWNALSRRRLLPRSSFPAADSAFTACFLAGSFPAGDSASTAASFINRIYAADIVSAGHDRVSTKISASAAAVASGFGVNPPPSFHANAVPSAALLYPALKNREAEALPGSYTRRYPVPPVFTPTTPSRSGSPNTSTTSTLPPRVMRRRARTSHGGEIGACVGGEEWGGVEERRRRALKTRRRRTRVVPKDPDDEEDDEEDDIPLAAHESTAGSEGNPWYGAWKRTWRGRGGGGRRGRGQEEAGGTPSDVRLMRYLPPPPQSPIPSRPPSRPRRPTRERRVPVDANQKEAELQDRLLKRKNDARESVASKRLHSSFMRQLGDSGREGRGDASGVVEGGKILERTNMGGGAARCLLRASETRRTRQNNVWRREEVENVGGDASEGLKGVGRPEYAKMPGAGAGSPIHRIQACCDRQNDGGRRANNAEGEVSGGLKAVGRPEYAKMPGAGLGRRSTESKRAATAKTTNAEGEVSGGLKAVGRPEYAKMPGAGLGRRSTESKRAATAKTTVDVGRRVHNAEGEVAGGVEGTEKPELAVVRCAVGAGNCKSSREAR
ncbi:hypothetical protein R3P38DRAFT_2805937 [Favolaschia claudopus]|uniref:Uncharacterized protein n=1 Tax=Favolaschia claudopus TaxID=2862362 RepID=A0AAV9ZLV8_9AGAR